MRVHSNDASQNLPNLAKVNGTDVDSSGCALRHPFLDWCQHHLMVERHKSYSSFLDLHIYYYIMLKQ